jgi:two-component system sensor histidine kinase ChvG
MSKITLVDEHFGNNSGLCLAILEQIAKVCAGVRWAERIRLTEADIASELFDARFVDDLPV